VLQNLTRISCSSTFEINSLCKIKCLRKQVPNPTTVQKYKCTLPVGNQSPDIPLWIGTNKVELNASSHFCMPTVCPRIRKRLVDIEQWKCTDGNFVGSECSLSCPTEYLVYGPKRVICERFPFDSEPKWSDTLPICKARETFTLRNTIGNLRNFVSENFNHFKKYAKLNNTIEMIERKLTKALDGQTPCKIRFLPLDHPESRTFRGRQSQISRTAWKRTILKRTQDKTVSPENAKKMFEALSYTIERFFVDCAKYLKYHKFVQKAYDLVIRAIRHG